MITANHTTVMNSCIGRNIMFTYSFRPRGVCSQRMDITIDGDKVVSLQVLGGCDGNLQGIARLIEGMPIDVVIQKLSGISCVGKGTSCPDQLSKALVSLKAELASESAGQNAD